MLVGAGLGRWMNVDSRIEIALLGHEWELRVAGIRGRGLRMEGIQRDDMLERLEGCGTRD